MAQAASSPHLKQAFEHHIRQTHEHLSRLNRVFTSLNYGHSGETCEAMEGLLQEGEEIIQATGGS